MVLHLENNPEALEYIYSCGENMSNLDTNQVIKFDKLWFKFVNKQKYYAQVRIFKM